MPRMTDAEVMATLRSDTLLNQVRAIFSDQAAGLEQAAMQRKPPGPVESRRMEIEAAQKIIAVIKRKIAAIADDYIPDRDADAPQALQEMRDALKAFVEN